ncbi:MAG: NUDIX hydrolase [Rhodospirillales bacterium]|nr:NUDIX hydrolase [Rhodospirillales bacterium]
MVRKTIKIALDSYQPENEKEKTDREAIVAFMNDNDDCFHRSCVPGHITGSALLINRTGDKVLLNHHRKLDLWMQFGGHCDGESDVLSVARRECIEESGIENVELVMPDVFDLDVHVIPENTTKGEPEHKHYDIRYLFRVTDDSDFVLSDESHDLRWCTYEEAKSLTTDPSVHRMLDKWRRMCEN